MHPPNDLIAVITAAERRKLLYELQDTALSAKTAH